MNLVTFTSIAKYCRWLMNEQVDNQKVQMHW